MSTARVFNVQRFSLYDGPGVRTVVFFKGCPLRCLWCHNPESQSAAPEPALYPDKCVCCGACKAFCARAFTDACRRCGACVRVCRHSARELIGREEDTDAILRTVLRDVPFYRTSGGGVTLSGGEPLAQPQAAYEILSGCKAQGVHTAVETAGHVPWESFARLLPVTDLFLFDLKGMDTVLHRKNTGVSNDLILENARRLSAADAGVRFRMPLVPGYNDHEAPAVAAFAKSCGRPLELLAYHRIGEGKYASLGRTYAAPDAAPPDASAVRALAQSIGADYEETGL